MPIWPKIEIASRLFNLPKIGSQLCANFQILDQFRHFGPITKICGVQFVLMNFNPILLKFSSFEAAFFVKFFFVKEFFVLIFVLLKISVS